MRKANIRLKFDTVPVLLIFCVFAVSALIVLALSGSVYKSTVEITGEGYEEQTCLSYVWTKVKSSDVLDRVYVEDFHGLSALFVEEEFDGITYTTLIYCYDGWIRELFFESGLSFSPSDGMQIVEGGSLVLESAGDGLIKATSGEESIFISLRSKSGERSGQD